MDTDEQDFYLRLLTLHNDIVMDVIHIYFEREVLDKTTFFLFLEKCLHILFHEFIPSVKCCQCISHVSLAKPIKSGRLRKNQFEELYDACGSVKENHQIVRSGTTEQHCLCKFSPKRVEVNQLDIILILALMKICFQSYPGNPKWFEDIKEVRNFLHHLGNACLKKSDFDSKWLMLEKNAINIAGISGKSHQASIIKRVEDLKTKINNEDNIKRAITETNESFKKKIVDVLQNYNQDSNVRMENIQLTLDQVLLQVTNLEMDISKDELLEEQENSSSVTANYSSNAVITSNTDHKTSTDYFQQEPDHVSTEVPTTGHNHTVQTAIPETQLDTDIVYQDSSGQSTSLYNTQDNSSAPHIAEQQSTIHVINARQSSVPATSEQQNSVPAPLEQQSSEPAICEVRSSIPNVKEPHRSVPTAYYPDDSSRCYIQWKIAKPGNCNLEALKRKLLNVTELSDFKIEFVYIGSLIINTSASATLLDDYELFADRIDAFLRALIKECQICPLYLVVVEVEIKISLLPFEWSLEVDSKEECTDYCSPCNYRKCTTLAVFLCPVCKEQYCNECAEVHKAMKLLRHHELQPTDIKSAPRQPILGVQNRCILQ